MAKFSYVDDRPEGAYLSRAEKELLAEEGTVFPLLSVKFESTGGYKGASRYLVETEIEGEEKRISFGLSTTDNPASRDRFFAAVQEYLETDGSEAVFARAEMIGAYLKVFEAEGSD